MLCLLSKLRLPTKIWFLNKLHCGQVFYNHFGTKRLTPDGKRFCQCISGNPDNFIVSISFEYELERLVAVIHRTYYLFFKLHEIINKHVLAYVCYYSFCNEILMIHVFFSNVQIFFKRYFTIYVILDFTSYEKNVSFQYLIFINNTYFTQIIFSLFLQYLT